MTRMLCHGPASHGPRRELLSSTLLLLWVLEVFDSLDSEALIIISSHWHRDRDREHHDHVLVTGTVAPGPAAVTAGRRHGDSGRAGGWLGRSASGFAKSELESGSEGPAGLVRPARVGGSLGRRAR